MPYWKDFEHEVAIKLNSYTEEYRFKLIPKPIVKHVDDRAPYRLPDFLMMSDENKLILFLDCKHEKWKKIDLDSLDRLGWAIRGFIDNKTEYDLPNSSIIRLPDEKHKECKDENYLLMPVLLCTGADFNAITLDINLPKTETKMKYTILNFKYLDDFIKGYFKVPSFASSLENVRKRIKKGDIPDKQLNEFIKIVEPSLTEKYGLELKVNTKILKGSDLEKILRFIYTHPGTSPSELERFGNAVFRDYTKGDYSVESIPYDTKILLSFGTEKTAELVMKLLRRGLLSVKLEPMIWMIDGRIVLQDKGAKFLGDSYDGKMFPIVFYTNDKAEEELAKIYGSKAKIMELHDTY